MEKAWELVKSVVTSRPLLMIVLGAAFLVLALASGVQYNKWLPIDGTPARTIAGGIGVGLVLLSYLHPRATSLSDHVVRSLGITIIDPANNAEFDKATVRGTIAKSIPWGFELRLLRGYPAGGFVPNSHVVVDMDKHEWFAADFDIGGEKGNARRIEAWVVGPDGTALLDCWQEALNVFRLAVDQLASIEPKPYVTWLRPIQKPTRDMYRCAVVQVKRR